MSNTHRYRRGDQEIIEAPVDDTTLVEIGDFMCRVASADSADDATLTDDNCCPVTYLVDAGDAAANREAGADQFLGIALTQSLDGQTDEILIATEGFFELTQKAAAAIDIGDGVEMYSSAVNCEDQTVVEGSTSPIAVCVEDKPGTTLTGVLCKLLPSKLLGTAQG